MRIIHETELEGTIVHGTRGEVTLKDIINEPGLVAGIRIVEPDSDVPGRPHSHEDSQIVYVIKGKTSLFNGFETRELQAGDFVVFEPDEEHYFTSGEEEVILFEVKWK